MENNLVDAICRPDVQLAIFAKNVAKDPNYAPYCMVCPGLTRMRVIEPMLWDCKCGSVHDERNIKLEPAAEAFVAALP